MKIDAAKPEDALPSEPPIQKIEDTPLASNDANKIGIKLDEDTVNKVEVENTINSIKEPIEATKVEDVKVEAKADLVENVDKQPIDDIKIEDVKVETVEITEPIEPKVDAIVETVEEQNTIPPEIPNVNLDLQNSQEAPANQNAQIPITNPVSSENIYIEKPLLNILSNDNIAVPEIAVPSVVEDSLFKTPEETSKEETKPPLFNNIDTPVPTEVPIVFVDPYLNDPNKIVPTEASVLDKFPDNANNIQNQNENIVNDNNQENSVKMDEISTDKVKTEEVKEEKKEEENQGGWFFSSPKKEEMLEVKPVDNVVNEDKTEDIKVEDEKKDSEESGWFFSSPKKEETEDAKPVENAEEKASSGWFSSPSEEKQEEKVVEVVKEELKDDNLVSKPNIGKYNRIYFIYFRI